MYFVYFGMNFFVHIHSDRQIALRYFVCGFALINDHNNASFCTTARPFSFVRNVSQRTALVFGFFCKLLQGNLQRYF